MWPAGLKALGAKLSLISEQSKTHRFVARVFEDVERHLFLPPNRDHRPRCPIASKISAEFLESSDYKTCVSWVLS